jgi:hypothetical protein
MIPIIRETNIQLNGFLLYCHIGRPPELCTEFVKDIK